MRFFNRFLIVIVVIVILLLTGSLFVPGNISFFAEPPAEHNDTASVSDSVADFYTQPDSTAGTDVSSDTGADIISSPADVPSGFTAAANSEVKNDTDAGDVDSVDIEGEYEDGESPEDEALTVLAEQLLAYGGPEFLDAANMQHLLDVYADEILDKVTIGYEGDFTLEWALENDLSDFEKEIWINAMDYPSRTDYLIWVNLAFQRVNIFQKSGAGDTYVDSGSGDIESFGENSNPWKLIRSCLAGTGTERSGGTPPGVTYVTGRQDGWNFTSYVVRPVVNFYSGTSYAFHSRLYYPDGVEMYDPAIGYPVSHGCVRMYDEDILFLYYNIPMYTTVVIN